MHYSFGNVVIVDFPYSDFSESKRRPALVLAHDTEGDIVVARITSKARESDSDAVLIDWAETNLLFSSTMCMAKLATLSSRLVEKKIGDLSGRDKKSALTALQNFVDSLKQGATQS